MNTRYLTRRTAIAAVTLAATGTAWAQGLGARTVRILVGFAPGGASDMAARIYAAKLQELLNTPVIVENKPGAMQLVAARATMTAAPDGFTLWFATSSSLVQSAGVRRDIPFDPLNSFTPIAKVADVDGIFAVRSSLPVTSMRELIAYVRANPGKLNYGSAGVGSANHLLTEYLKLLTKTDITHIPYRNDADVVRELVGETVDFAIVGSGSIAQFAGHPKVRFIAITGASRSRAMPDLPTVAESGVPELKELGEYLFYAVMGPPNMPPTLVQSLNQALTKAATSPDVVDKLGKQFFRPASGSPAEFRSHIEMQLALWKNVGKTLKLDFTNS